MKLTLRIWRQASARRQGQDEEVRARRRRARHVVPRDARRAQREARARRPGPGLVRPRLPRGHLRLVRHGHQRHGARPAEEHHHLPAAHAALHRRRHDRHRAVAGQGVPGDQGPRHRPQRVRRDHQGRRLHLASTPARRPRPTRSRWTRSRPTTRSTPPPASAAAPASRPAPTAARCCSPRPRSPTSACCPQGQPERATRAINMLAKQDELDFGGCTNVGACHEVCPKGIPLASIAQLNHDVLGATLVGRALGLGVDSARRAPSAALSG